MDIFRKDFVLLVDVKCHKKMKLLVKVHLLVVVFLSGLMSLSVNAQVGMNFEEVDLLSEEEQLVAYQILVGKEPQNARFQNSLGFCYYRMKNYDMAEKHYAEALMLNPTYSTAYNNLGVVCLKKGQYDMSKHCFEKALEYNSHNVKAVYNLGVTHFREGNYLRALRYYLESKNMDADYVKERGDWEKMKKEVDEALQKDPENHILKKVSSRLNDSDKNK